MTRKGRNILIIVLFVVGVFALEMGREKFEYVRASRRLERSYWLLRRGMTKDQVRQSIGEPERVNRQGEDEYWYWFAGNHQGFFWTHLGLASKKGHYGLIATFDKNGKLTNFYGGVN